MSDTATPDSISIILPAYNEEAALRPTVTALQDWVTDQDLVDPAAIDIVIVEDGCTDETAVISAELADAYDNVTRLHFDERLGKGRAVATGFTEADGAIRCFMDVDRSTDISGLSSLLQPIRDGTVDITVGSRYAQGSDTDRGLKRDLMSRTYNFAARSLLKTGIRDHQCGFKAVRDDVFEQLDGTIVADGWFWDTEFLYMAQQHGYTVRTVPITWEADTDSSVDMPATVAELGTGLARLKGTELLGDRYDTVAKYVRFAAIGAFGAVVNTGLLYAFTEFAGLHYLISAATSIEIAVITVFFLNNYFTFSNTKETVHHIVDGIIRSNLVRVVGIGVQMGLLFLLTEIVGLYYILSNVFAIFVASLFNFTGEKRFNWQE
jgi:putative flippase GtrA